MIYTHEERNDAFPGCIYTDNVNLWWIYDAFPGCIYTDNVNLWFNNISLNVLSMFSLAVGCK